MLSIHVVSDLHLESRYFLDTKILPPIFDNTTILILAGDISDASKDLQLLSLFLDHVSRIYDYVIYVPGNYEYIPEGGTYVISEDIRALCESFGTIFLVDEYVELYGYLFYGSNLWSYLPPEKDFSEIGEVQAVGIEERNRLFSESLQKLEIFIENHPNSIIITHYPPTMYFTETKYPESNILENYGNELEDLIPKSLLWICGHTHYSAIIRVDGTPVVSNCLGRLGEEGCCFNPQLILKMRIGGE